MQDAQDDSHQQANAECAAQKTQLFPNHGKDEVCVLGGDGVRLSLCAVKQTLSRETAAGNGIEGTGGLVAHTCAAGINSFVKDHKNTLLLIVLNQRTVPQNRNAHRQQRTCGGKPDKTEAAGQSHNDKGEHIDQSHAGHPWRCLR